MSGPRQFDDCVWERLFEFAFPDEQEMTRKELRAELQRLRSDVRPVVENVLRAVASTKEQQRAQAALKEAKSRRERVLGRLSKIAREVSSGTTDQLRSLIAQEFQSAERAALFRKLEAVASDEDLKSLLDDLSKLDVLEDEMEDDETGGK